MHIEKATSIARRSTRCIAPLRDIGDVEALEQIPYDELVPARSVYELFVNTAALHGERPALTTLRSASPTDVGVALTHRALLAEVTRAANLFASLGIRDGEVVSIVGRPHDPIPTLIWGAETAGVVSCLNHMLTAEVIAELLRAESAKVLVCTGPELDPDLWPKMRHVIERSPGLAAVLVIGGSTADLGPGIVDARAALAAQPSDRLVFSRPLTRDTRAALFHTGGTTGLPKLVPHTHGNQIHAAWAFAQTFGITEQDVGLNGLPMFHVGGTSTWGLSLLAAGAHIVVMTPAGYRDPAVVRQVWTIAAHFRATMVGSVPTTIGAMAETPTDGLDLSSLRMAQTGGATLSATVAERFERRAGIPLLEQYGMTESVATIAGTPFAGAQLRGSAGLRCPFSGLRVVRDPTQTPLVDCEPGSIGAVITRGRQVVTGYLDERQNRAAFTAEGWLVTGDLGYLTNEQYLVLTGREKDLIIRGGHNIDPAAIEEVANRHPDVATSAAVGMPDAYAGEIPVIFVVMREGASTGPAELAAYVGERVAEPPAKPRHVFVIDALPTTAVGKVFKPALREQAVCEKLRLELAALGMAAAVTGLQCAPGAAGRLHAQVTLHAPASAAASAGEVQARLMQAVRDLSFDVAVTWV